MPVQGTCQPSVRKSFFFGGSFGGSFCSFAFDIVAVGADLEAAVFGCIFNRISVLLFLYLPLLNVDNSVPYQSAVPALRPLDNTRQEWTSYAARTAD